MVTAKEEGVSKGYESLPSFLTCICTSTAVSKLLVAVSIDYKCTVRYIDTGLCWQSRKLHAAHMEKFPYIERSSSHFK